jgi:hypothetical protein
MADRYQSRPLPADNYDRGDDPHDSARSESDPLAELARLIGQTDPFGTMGRANAKLQPRSRATDRYDRPAEPESDPRAGPPPWMQRAARHEEAPQQDYQPLQEHPLRRYATPVAAPAAEPNYDEPAYEAADQASDPSRYDDALYGQPDIDEQSSQHPAYADDGYEDQEGYGEDVEQLPPKRRGGMVTVFLLLAMAVVGTGAAFAYRTYIGPPRAGEPPIIKADNSPTKVVPAPSDGAAKVPDRMAAGDGTEKIVPREEAPVDVNAKSSPRVVFPPLNQNGNPPSTASVAPSGSTLASAANGTLPNSEPRKIKTFSVRGEQPDGAATPVTGTVPSAAPAKPGAAAKTTPAASHMPSATANASANAPLSLAPQGAQSAPAAEPRTRIASTNPAQSAPSGAASGGGYVVQVSSQRNEADAQASYRALQSKFPSVLGSRSPLIKRADLGEKGVYYRAMVGPFGTSDEASQFCGSLKTAGGQCVVQRN